jgi:hypothetical protein
MLLAPGINMRSLGVLVLLTTVACGAERSEAGPVASATSATMHTATNPGAAFDRYRTFSFGPSEGVPADYPMSARSLEVQHRLQPFIAAALTQKGYVPVTGKADVFVRFGSGQLDTSREIIDMEAGWLPDDEIADFVEGSLVIDAFDGTGGHRVWHGASLANIDPDRIDDQLLERSVKEILSLFPEANGGARTSP